jgi:hypothetical protein
MQAHIAHPRAKLALHMSRAAPGMARPIGTGGTAGEFDPSALE